MTEPLRVLVVAAPKTGNHMLAAAIRKSYGPIDRVEMGYTLDSWGWPNWRSWVVSTHDPYTAKLQRAADDRGVRIIGLDRHIAGHLLSYLGGITVDSIDFQALSTSTFAEARSLIHRVPQHLRVSYDNLADPSSPNHRAECRKVAEILGQNRLLEVPGWGDSKVLSDPAANYKWVVGDPHRWQRIFTEEQISLLSSAVDGTALELC